MALYTLAPAVKRQLLDDSGNPLAGGFLYIVSAGGSYPANAVTTYQTSSGTAHSQPITLDSAGRISGTSELYLQPGQSYKFIVKDSNGVQLWSQDNVSAVPPSTVNVDIQGTAGENIAAEDVVYLKTTDGLWYKADADSTSSSSDAVTVGMAPLAITSGAVGTIRLEGELTVTGPLVAGSSYYASATAGALTVTEPTNSRFIGQAQSTTSIVITPNRGGAGTGGSMNYLQLAVFGT